MLAEMTSTGLRGPYALVYDVVDAEVADNHPGTYVLGYIDFQGRFCVNFVGSSPTDLRAKLKERIGTAQCFKFRHFVSDRAAFEKECELFHQFLPSGNFLHPDRPPNTTWRCPRCSREKT
jgi:hypothetical protein